jgi:hypothetical protein
MGGLGWFHTVVYDTELEGVDYGVWESSGLCFFSLFALQHLGLSTSFAFPHCVLLPSG